MSLTNSDVAFAQNKSTPQLQGIDYVELYVGNARQAEHFFRTAFGFKTVAYSGLETGGQRDRVSYVMQQGESFLLLTTPLGSEGPVAEYVRIHGDGIKDIGFRVKDVARTFHGAVELGAHPLLEPTTFADDSGQLQKATVAAYGDTVHSFVQRDDFHGAFFPEYQAVDGSVSPWTGLHTFDHFAISLPPGEMEQWADFYTRIFGFQPIHEEGITTEYSAMNSKAVQDPAEQIRFVLIEPLPGKRKSQIEEFLKYHQGPGVQHMALHSQDIIKTIQALENNGVAFVAAPESYYEMLVDRVGQISEDTAALRKVNVLVDRDEWGYLLQIFSRPVQSRPTLFIEIIQRKQARGFGSGNIQALFKALEREQAKRGNL